jgi:translation initiation factor IF-3
MIGVVDNKVAQEMALQAGKDLVEINENQRPPICKIMDYGKFCYEQQKREKEQKKLNKQAAVKEVQFSPNVESNDVNTKTRQIREFLGEGHKVRITMRFKGRDLQHTDLGKAVFDKIVSDFSDVSKIEQKTEFDGKNLAVIISRK